MANIPTLDEFKSEFSEQINRRFGTDREGITYYRTIEENVWCSGKVLASYTVNRGLNTLTVFWNEHNEYVIPG